MPLQLMAVEPWQVFAGLIGGIILLVFFLVVANFGLLYIQAFLSGAHVSIVDLIGMRLRKVDPRMIVINRITAVKAGLPIDTNKLEAHCLAGGRVERVVQALIAASKAGIALTWDGRSPGGPRHSRGRAHGVNPKIIITTRARTPRRRRGVNGIQLKVKARVTVRTNLDRLLGGATENHHRARRRNSCLDRFRARRCWNRTRFRRVLERAWTRGRRSRSCQHRGRRRHGIGWLRADQAESDKKVAQAEAGTRPSRPSRRCRRGRWRTARVIKAEAEIPLAIAGRSGRQPRDHGLLQDEERDGGHGHAEGDRGSGRRRRPWRYRHGG